MVSFREVDDVLIEGITFVHPPSHNIRINGDRHIVRNVKCFGWHFSTDGAQAGSNSMIEDSFFKVNDDAIMLYRSNSSARRCVVWQMENGSPFQIGWSGDEPVSNFHAYDCDVIRMESEWDNENLAVFCSIHGGNAEKSRYLYEDIRIENCDWRLFSLVTRPNRWAQWYPESGSLTHLTFRNITYHGVPRVPSHVVGHDEKHPIKHVTFDNVVIDGKKLTGASPDVILIDNETVHDVVFK
jgi:hypothetical protein